MTEPIRTPSDDICVVIINYNGGARLMNTVRAVRDQALPDGPIVIVDNASTDGSAQAVRQAFAGVEVLAMGENVGLPKARNAGLAHVGEHYSRRRFVLLLDADVYVTPGSVETLHRAAVDHSAAVVCPRVVYYPDCGIVQCDGAAPHFIGTLRLLNADGAASAPVPPTGRVSGLIGAAMLLDREAVVAAGGFSDLYFFYFEDLEFSLRMRLAGLDIVCAPEAVAEHDRGRGTVGLSFRGAGAYPARRAHLTMRNRWLTIFLCYSGRSIILLLPALVAYEGLTLLFALRRGHFRQWLGAWAWLIRNRTRILRERRVTQGLRVRRDRELLSGGSLPLTAGLLHGRMAARAVSVLGSGFSAYWRLMMRWS